MGVKSAKKGPLLLRALTSSLLFPDLSRYHLANAQIAQGTVTLCFLYQM